MAVKLVTLAFNSGRQAAMVDFYRALGANLQRKQISKGGESFFGILGNLEIEIYSIAKKASLASPDFSMRFQVLDIAATIQKVKQLPDFEIIMDIEMLPDGKKAIVVDPDGHSVELIQYWSATGSD